MSNLYNLEPQPTAKVILHTTSGDLSLELFAKQTPLASRNFLQHCLDGYYNNTIFHRLVPNFIIQGGDPTGTGSGGESAINNGTPFEDEFHSRLKFNRRGLLGMANEGKDSNGSQFFLTLGVTAELQGKHTLFGRIEGDTIYNLMKMGDAELAEGEGSERPLYPTRITGAEVIVNPFEEMVARVREAPRTMEDGGKGVKKRKKNLGKNVLSFGAEEGEEEQPVLKKAKADPKLFAAEELKREKEVIPKQKKKAIPQRVQEEGEDEDEIQEVKTKPVQKPQTEPEEDSDNEPEPAVASRSKLAETNAEIAALKASMKRKVDTAPKEKEKPKSLLESMIPSSSTRGRKRGKAVDEKGAFDLFKAFKSRLDSMPDEGPTDENDTKPTNGHNVEPTTAKDAADEEAELCDLHFIANCQSCKSWDDEKPEGEAEADGDDDTWMAHRLTFAKDTLGKDLEWKKKMEEIEVIDPREKAHAIQQEQKRAKESRKKR